MSDALENAAPKERAISISGLSKSYGKREVISDLDIAVAPGEVYGYIGRNGSGKSTTIGCLVGIKPFRKGRILICGNDIQKETVEAKKRLGYVPSEPSLYEVMSGREFLSFIGSSFRMNKEDLTNRIEELCARLDFNPFDLTRKIAHYSLGMKQKLAIMSSLIHDPQVWVLDEPTNGLDGPASDALAHLIRERAAGGTAVFITSHSIDFVSSVCDRVAFLHQGKIESTIDNSSRDVKVLAAEYSRVCLPDGEEES